MKLLLSLTLAAAAIFPAGAGASPPIPDESVAVLRSALPLCSGGWDEYAGTGIERISPASLAPRLDLLARPSIELDRRAGEDLYQIAKGFLTPAAGVPEWALDGGPYLKCPARPKEAVALMEYLAGTAPTDRRGYSNVFDWLGLAYETGAGGVKDAERARRYYLRMRIQSHMTRNARWSDGIDDDVLANVARAGMRPYLEALARAPRDGGQARMLLADAILPTDPVEARRLLRYPDSFAVSRLIELEKQGRIPVVADAEDIGFWAEAVRTIGDYRGLGSRLLTGVRLANGGDIPTSPARPAIGLLRSYLDMEQAADARAEPVPVAMRALVSPAGRAIHIEACHAHPTEYVPMNEFVAQRRAVRLYNAGNIARLPKLPITTARGRAVYGWVLLPAVRFADSDDGKVEVRFENAAADRCLRSGFAETQPIVPVAPPGPRNVPSTK